MQEPKVLEINGKSCRFELYEWDNYPNDVSLDYIEYACDYWSSDTHTSISITEEMAKNIIKFLQLAFKLKD